MLGCTLELHAGDDFLKKPTNSFWMTTKMRKLGLVHGQVMNRKRDEISWMNCSLCIIQPAVLISALRTVPVPRAANSETPFDFSGSRTEPSENGPGACSLCNASCFLFLLLFLTDSNSSCLLLKQLLKCPAWWSVNHRDRSVPPVPRRVLCPMCSLKGKVFHVSSCFAFIQRRREAWKPFGKHNPSRNVTRPGGAGIKCLHSEPRNLSWAFNFFFLFFFSVYG